MMRNGNDDNNNNAILYVVLHDALPISTFIKQENNTTIGGQVIYAGELVARGQYL